MKESYRFYRGCYRVARAFFGVFFRIEVSGRENIPEGAAMVCVNHSSVFDPIFIAFAFGIDHFLHFVAKAELFKIPVLSAVIKGFGAISVNREASDVATVKNILAYLKNGEKVAIFPEGTRSSTGGSVSAKSGAVKIAERSRAPLIPVYVPRKKRVFSKVSMVIGQQINLENTGKKRTQDDYMKIADVMMQRINALSTDAHTGV